MGQNVYLILHAKINSQWIRDLNQQLDIIQLLEENIKETLQDIGIDKNYLHKSSEAQVIKAKIGECDKLVSFRTTKETLKVKRQSTG